VASACLFCVVGSTSASSQTYDHLKCYKIKDLQTFKRASVDLDVLSGLFAGIDHCKIKGRAKELCIPAAKSNVSVVGGSETPLVGQEHGFERLCYKLKCPKPGLAATSFTDQFGTRSLDRFKAVKLCTPAVMGPDPARCPLAFELTPIAGLSAGGATSPTRQETGFTGLYHSQEIPEGFALPLDATCAGLAPACGDCSLGGVSGAFGRCSNDPTLSCNTVNGPDADDCGGALCNFYIFPPRHLSGAGVPACVEERLAVDVTGTINNESGAAAIALDLRGDVFIGISHQQPCPLCSGDATANDGVRGGVCNGGTRNSLACDANGQDATWGPTSLDCPPDPMNLVSGAGLVTNLTLGDASVSLPFSTPCDFPLAAMSCACALCSGDTTVACIDDAECAAIGAGTCSASVGLFRKPSDCTPDPAICNDIGGGIGECPVGPDDSFCGGVVRASGEGFIPCSTDADCEPVFPGSGACDSVVRRRCFPNPITAMGAAHPSLPVLVDAVCVPPPAADMMPPSSIWGAVGLPGPKRVIRSFVLNRGY